MQKLNVLYQSNDTFAPYLGTSLQSLLANNTALEELNVYLVNIDISQENIEKLKKLFPEIVGEGNKIDIDKLKLTLGEDINTSNERYVLNWAGKSEAFCRRAFLSAR